MLAILGLLKCLGGALAALLFAQAPDPSLPTFEVASVKLNKSGTALKALHFERDRLIVTNFGLKIVLQFAYNTKTYLITGGPGWIDSEMFDITGKAAGSTDKEQLRLMCRSLLAERFKFAAHTETREMAIYELVRAKGGPKFPEAKPFDPGPQPTANVQVVRVIAESRFFVDRLSTVLERPVIDKTDIVGKHNFTIVMARDQPVADGGIVNEGTFAPASIFGALEEQLGLKLISKKAPVEVLVIDHVEKPTGN